MSARFATIVYVFSLIAVVCAEPTQAPDRDTRLKSAFGAYEGCAIIREVGGKTLLRYNDQRCTEPFSPCSTFKIFNAMAGLESGAVTGPDMILKWDGTKQSYKSWEHDHTLATAIRDSVVWYFREVARRVGAEKMQKYLNENHYGNRDTSAGLDKFWLQASLTISADQQIDFLERMYSNKVTFSPKVVDTVKRLIIQKESGDTTFSGKTGSGKGDKSLGWFVGHVRNKDKQYVFAVNISGEGAWGPEAKKIAEQILIDQGLLPK